MAPEALVKYGAASEVSSRSCSASEAAMSLLLTCLLISMCVSGQVYSLGLVLLELASGRLVGADTKEEVAEATDDGTKPDGLAGEGPGCGAVVAPGSRVLLELPSGTLISRLE